MSFLSPSPLVTLGRRWRMALLVALLFALAAGGVTLLFPLEYRADADVFIIAKTRYGVDPYTVVRSAERVAENIAQIMTTSDFYDKVMAAAPQNVDRSRFDGPGISERIKRERWQKAIVGKVIVGTGVLRVSAYSPEPSQAMALAGAAAETLSSKGWEYIGGDVAIKVVNAPVVTRFPARPNIVLNVLLGFLVGAVSMGMVVIRRYG